MHLLKSFYSYLQIMYRCLGGGGGRNDMLFTQLTLDIFDQEHILYSILSIY